MNWRDLMFWRQPAIVDLDAFAEFVDERAAFLVQKGLHEYSRARAGHYAKVLFNEREFMEAIDRSRWTAYPLGLAMVGEVAEGVLRRHAEVDAVQQADALRGFVLSLFDRYPTPAVLGEAAWSNARNELDERLRRLGLHPPKRAIDIPEPYARIYWDLMPINKEIRTRDFPTTHSYLRIMLCNIHDELTRRADLAAIARQLREASVGSAAPATDVAAAGEEPVVERATEAHRGA
jgi:hypothetical protein